MQRVLHFIASFLLCVDNKQVTGIVLSKHSLPLQAHMLGLLSSPSQPLPEVGRHDQHSDLRSKFFKQRQLLVMNVANKDQLTSYFEVGS